MTKQRKVGFGELVEINGGALPDTTLRVVESKELSSFMDAGFEPEKPAAPLITLESSAMLGDITESIGEMREGSNGNGAPRRRVWKDTIMLGKEVATTEGTVARGEGANMGEEEAMVGKVTTPVEETIVGVAEVITAGKETETTGGLIDVQSISDSPGLVDEVDGSLLD